MTAQSPAWGQVDPTPEITADANGGGMDLKGVKRGSASKKEENAGQSLEETRQRNKNSTIRTSDGSQAKGPLYCADDEKWDVNEGCVDATLDICEEDEVLISVVDTSEGEVLRTNPCIGVGGDRPELSASGPPEEEVDIADRPDLVASEFARINMPLPEPRFQEEIEDQVVPGRMWGAGWRQTNVNMWAVAEDHTTTVTLLGTDVTIRATPLKYTWDYGDGQTRTTAFAGQEVHAGAGGASGDTETATSHYYEETGFYPVSVTAVYAGQFRTPTSDWLPIPGVAVVTSDTKTLTIWKSETRLVASDCGDDHSAWGCARIPFPWEGGPQTSEAYKDERARLEGR
ncbi:hypothetical protein GCM10027591_03150 [Zhihengliuella somnathii]